MKNFEEAEVTINGEELNVGEVTILHMVLENYLKNINKMKSKEHPMVTRVYEGAVSAILKLFTKDKVKS